MVIDKFNPEQNYNYLLPAARDYVVLYFDSMQIKQFLTVSLYRVLVWLTHLINSYSVVPTQSQGSVSI